MCNKCINCFKEYNMLIYLPLYGNLCKYCYVEIIQDYLK